MAATGIDRLTVADNDLNIRDGVNVGAGGIPSEGEITTSAYIQLALVVISPCPRRQKPSSDRQEGQVQPPMDSGRQAVPGAQSPETGYSLGL